jgi:hypothetical protein
MPLRPATSSESQLRETIPVHKVVPPPNTFLLSRSRGLPALHED